MRRVMLTLAVLALLGLVTGTALAGHPSHKSPSKGGHVDFSLASHGHGGHGHHHGYGGYHHGHGHPHGYHRGPGVVIVPAPVYRPAVVVPAYPSYYYYEPRPSGSIGIYGRKFGFSVDF